LLWKDWYAGKFAGPGVPILALTATASTQRKKEIASIQRKKEIASTR
jgi:hypothetical protein